LGWIRILSRFLAPIFDRNIATAHAQPRHIYCSSGFPVSPQALEQPTIMDGFEDGALSRLLIPDAMTPGQYYEGARSDAAIRPIKRLMLAVLEDGLHCFQAYANAGRGVGRQIFVETEGWLSDRRADGPFAFETICHTLGIDPNFLRKGLRQWRLQQLTGMNPPRLARRSPVRVGGPICVPHRRRSRPNARRVGSAAQTVESAPPAMSAAASS
jgi:hypothetical protein